MKLKDTIHFNWYKHLFIMLVIGLYVATNVGVTETDILDVFGNLEQMSGFLSRSLKPDFSCTPELIGPMISTFRVSVVGTAPGAMFAVSVAFLGTTVMTGSRVVTSAVRFFLDIVRTIPNLLLAALMAATVRIEELTGAMTITVFTFGLASQLVCEAIEAIDEGPIETAVSMGTDRVQIAFWSVTPQVMNQVTEYTLYALEVNMHASAVLGYVSAGGIGVVLNSSLALLQYDRVSIIILLILVMVAAVDGLGEVIRRRLA